MHWYIVPKECVWSFRRLRYLFLRNVRKVKSFFLHNQINLKTSWFKAMYVFHTGQPSIAKCKKVRRKREQDQELAELDVTNIISTQGIYLSFLECSHAFLNAKMVIEHQVAYKLCLLFTESYWEQIKTVCCWYLKVLILLSLCRWSFQTPTWNAIF